MDIRPVQAALIAKGYDLGPGGADNIPGRMTTQAVAAFQRDAGLSIQFPGTIGPKTIAALGLPEVDTLELLPPWYVEARRKLGLREKADNKTLREYLKSDGATLGDPAKSPWCGDFMETVIALTLPNEPMIENPYWALNWEKFGVPLSRGFVPLGAIAPFKRPGGGHIGQIVGHDRTHFHVLGGNQSNAITIAKLAKERLSGPLRWPKTYPLPTIELAFSTLDATISTNEA